jgi:hypothetical protein
MHIGTGLTSASHCSDFHLLFMHAGRNSVATAVGYPHSSTSISISKKKYSIPVIEILYSIFISPASVLSLSHTLYLLFHILFTSLPPSLSPTLARVPAGRYAPVRDTGAQWGRAHATSGVAAGLRSGVRTALVATAVNTLNRPGGPNQAADYLLLSQDSSSTKDFVSTWLSCDCRD